MVIIKFDIFFICPPVLSLQLVKANVLLKKGRSIRGGSLDDFIMSKSFQNLINVFDVMVIETTRFYKAKKNLRRARKFGLFPGLPLCLVYSVSIHG